MTQNKAYFHLPGLFEFYELYARFFPLWTGHREWFYDWCEIGSIYGAPSQCLWAGGRSEESSTPPQQVLALLEKYNISARLTFSNSLLEKEHLKDLRCNALSQMFEHGGNGHNGIILHSDLLLHYMEEQYPGFYFVSSTTKVLTDFNDFLNEINREEFAYAVPDFRLNPKMEQWQTLNQRQKDKVEFLCNEDCWFGCRERKACYEDVSRVNLGLESRHVCHAPHGNAGYRFSDAMKNPGFLSLDAIRDTYLPLGYTNFKIEGRGLGSALVLEFLLYYLTKPEYQIHVREKLYLDNMLDLF
jgi:hypothetical protein